MSKNDYNQNQNGLDTHGNELESFGLEGFEQLSDEVVDRIEIHHANNTINAKNDARKPNQMQKTDSRVEQYGYGGAKKTEWPQLRNLLCATAHLRKAIFQNRKMLCLAPACNYQATLRDPSRENGEYNRENVEHVNLNAIVPKERNQAKQIHD